MEFVGCKRGTEIDVTLRDRRLAAIVRRCQELPGEDLFQYLDDGRVVDVTSTDVNDYLRSLARGDRTAKDFRTGGGTVVAAEVLVDLGPADSERDADRRILTAIDAAAERLANTRAVARAATSTPASAKPTSTACWPKPGGPPVRVGAYGGASEPY